MAHVRTVVILLVLCLSPVGAVSPASAATQRTAHASSARALDLPPRAKASNVDYYRNRHSGLCMSVRAGSLTNNTLVDQDVCRGLASQQWAYEWGGGVSYYLRNVNSGKCLTVYGGSTANGAVLTQYTCLAQGNQRFYLDINTPSSSHLKAAHSGKCVRVRGASMSAGALLEQQPCNFSSSATDQLWNYT